MKMHVLNGGRLRMRKNVYIPDAERGDTIDLPVSCVLFRHSQGNILFDTGCHPSVIDHAEERWGAMAKAMRPIGTQDDNVLSGLKELGIESDDIDIVINSHLHSDHCGCNEFFKGATFFCHRKELEAAQGEDALQRGYIPADWSHPMPTRLVDSDVDVFGDGSLTLLPLPGHTAGTLGLLAELSRDGAFLLAADAVPLRVNLDRETMPRNTWNADAAWSSFKEIQRLQRGGTEIIFGHDPKQWDALRKGLDCYE